MFCFSPKRNFFGRGSVCGTASKSQTGNCKTRRDPGPLRLGARNVATRDHFENSLLLFRVIHGLAATSGDEDWCPAKRNPAERSREFRLRRDFQSRRNFFGHGSVCGTATNKTVNPLIALCSGN